MLFGSVADGDYVVELFIFEPVYVFRGMSGDIDSDFFHHFHASGMQAFRLGTSAVHIKSITRHIPKQSLRHLTAS
jgi:hypothetical protein